MTTQVYTPHDIEICRTGKESPSTPSNLFFYFYNNNNPVKVAAPTLLHRVIFYLVGLLCVLIFASCQDGQFPPIGTYENAEGEYYHFCTGNNFHCKISEIDHLLSGTYNLLGDSTILLTFYDEDGHETGDEVALCFSQCAPDSFYIEPVGDSPIQKTKFVKME